MNNKNNPKIVSFIKNSKRIFIPRFSFHYVAYTVLIFVAVFSVVRLVSATTPNPGHPWIEVGDGLIQFAAPSALRTYTGPDANATLLTTNDLVTVAQGGTGANTLASNGILYGNGTGPIQAVAVNAGATACLTQTASGAPVWGACGGGISDADKGDITVSGGGSVWTIDSLAVTDAKINDVAWAKITSTPTTLAGYSISDAVPTSRTINSQPLSANITLSTSDIPEGSNLYFTNVRAQSALSGLYESPLTFSSPLTRVGNTVSIPVATNSTGGYLSASDWNIFNGKQYALSGTGFVKSTGGVISYDTNTYLTTAITSLNGISSGTQTFAVGTAGTDFGISSVGTTHTFNIPSASGANRGLLASSDWNIFNGKQDVLTFSTGLTNTGNTITVNTSQNIAKLSNLTSNGFIRTSGSDGTLSVDTSTYLTGNQSITLSGAVTGSGTTAITTTLANGVIGIANLSATGTPNSSTYLRGDNTWATVSGGTVTSFAFTNGGGFTGIVSNASTTPTLSITLQNATTAQSGQLTSSDWNTFNGKQNAISLTTTGNSGASTFISNTLNIPTYTLAGLGGITLGSLSATSPIFYNNTTGVISSQPATTSVDGYLTATDWNTFNSKGSGTLTSVSGTANRITSTGGITPVIDISASYVGQSSITTLGTITTGVWNGTAIANANLANSSLTIGSTNISLGATSTTLAGLTSVSATTFTGALTGTASGNEVPLTFSTGLTRTTNTITNDLSTGISGGQSVVGGTASGDNLTLSSTTNGTKGSINFGTSSYDEVNNQLNITNTTQDTGLTITGNVNSFFQGNIQNTNSGSSASTDWVATADNGSSTTHYLDMGINGSGGGGAPFTTANHAYLYSIDDTLNLGALGASSQILFFTTGGTSPVQRMVIDNAGLVGINQGTPLAKLHINRDGIAATQSDAYGMILQNATAATSGVPVQSSPALTFIGNAWKSNATTANNEVKFRMYGQSVQGTFGSTAKGSFIIEQSLAGGAYADYFTVQTAGDANGNAANTYLSLIGLKVFGVAAGTNALYGGTVGGFNINNSSGSATFANISTTGVFSLTPTPLSAALATSALNITQTWNTSGTPTAIKLNITNTASNSASLLQDLQIGGVSRFSVGLGGSPTTGTIAITTAQNSFAPTSGTAVFNTSVISPTINQTGGANGITRGLYINPTLTAAADYRAIETASADYGNGAAGLVVMIGRNTNATNTGAGSINFLSKAGTNGYVWQDAAGNMRINTATPTNANDTSGTVIGAQTSTRDTKQDITDFTDYASALDMVTSAPLHTFRYIKEVQGYGINSPLAKPRIGYIADEVNPAFMIGNVIDQVSVNGILMASIKQLNIKLSGLSSLDISQAGSLGALMTQFFKDQSVLITNLSVGSLRITNEICVDDVCATKDEFKALLLQAKSMTPPVVITPPENGSGTSTPPSSDDTTPTTDAITPPEVTPVVVPTSPEVTTPDVPTEPVPANTDTPQP